MFVCSLGGRSRELTDMERKIHTHPRYLKQTITLYVQDKIKIIIDKITDHVKLKSYKII